MDRHLHLLKSGASRFTIKKGHARESGGWCPALPIADEGIDQGQQAGGQYRCSSRNAPIARDRIRTLETVISRQFKKKGDAVAAENLAIAPLQATVTRLRILQPSPGRRREEPNRSE